MALISAMPVPIENASSARVSLPFLPRQPAAGGFGHLSRKAHEGDGLVFPENEWSTKKAPSRCELPAPFQLCGCVFSG